MTDAICWLDIAIMLPILIGLIAGIIRGLIAELSTFIAMGAGVILSRMFAPSVALWFQNTCAWSANLSTMAAYVAIFTTVSIIVMLIGKVIIRLLKAIKLGWVNHLFGAVFGALKWCIVVLVLLFIVDKTDQQFHFVPNELKQQSILYQPALDIANDTWKQVNS